MDGERPSDAEPYEAACRHESPAGLNVIINDWDDAWKDLDEGCDVVASDNPDEDVSSLDHDATDALFALDTWRKPDCDEIVDFDFDEADVCVESAEAGNHTSATTPAWRYDVKKDDALSMDRVATTALSFDEHSILYTFKFASYHASVEVLASVVKVHGLGLVEVNRDVQNGSFWRARFQCACPGYPTDPSFSRRIAVGASRTMSCTCPWTIAIVKVGSSWSIQPPAPNHHHHTIVPASFAQPPADAYKAAPSALRACDPFAEFLTAQWCLEQDITASPFLVQHILASNSLSSIGDFPMLHEKHRHVADTESCLRSALAVFPIQETFPTGPFPTLFDAEMAFLQWNSKRGYKSGRLQRDKKAGAPHDATFRCVKARQARCPWHVQVAKCRRTKQYCIQSMHLLHSHGPYCIQGNTKKVSF